VLITYQNKKSFIISTIASFPSEIQSCSYFIPKQRIIKNRIKGEALKGISIVSAVSLLFFTVQLSFISKSAFISML
jgi:hypothetical protein